MVTLFQLRSRLIRSNNAANKILTDTEKKLAASIVESALTLTTSSIPTPPSSAPSTPKSKWSDFSRSTASSDTTSPQSILVTSPDYTPKVLTIESKITFSQTASISFVTVKKPEGGGCDQDSIVIASNKVSVATSAYGIKTRVYGKKATTDNVSTPRRTHLYVLTAKDHLNYARACEDLRCSERQFHLEIARPYMSDNEIVQLNEWIAAERLYFKSLVPAYGFDAEVDVMEELPHQETFFCGY
jgi:hypothetical protein